MAPSESALAMQSLNARRVAVRSIAWLGVFGAIQMLDAIGRFIALAARTGSKYSRMNAIFPSVARIKTT